MSNRVTDATVTPQDVMTALMKLRREGIGSAAAKLLQREPVLGDLIAGRWNKIQAILRMQGLSEEQARPVLIEVSRLAMEPVIALELSHRRMWQDFLPDVDDGKKEQNQ